MIFKNKLSWVIILLILLPVSGRSQIVINEYSCANENIISNTFGDHDDYFELYNAGTSAVDIGLYYLSDKASNPLKWQLPPGVNLNPGQFLLIFASGRDVVNATEYHTNFKLTQTRNEYIVLSNASGALVDQIHISPTQVNHCRARFPNGASDWSLSTTGTPGASNLGQTPEYPPTPEFSMQAGNYPSTIVVSISCSDPSATIRYTLDGTEPTAASFAYTTAFSISQTTVVKAKSMSATPGAPGSFTASNTYFINVNHGMPVISVSGTALNTLFSGNQTPRIGSFEFFDKDMNFIDESVGEYNKHGNDSWAYPQRGVDFVCKDELGYNAEIRHQIFPITERNDFQRLILKAAANDNYPSSNGGVHVRDAYIHTLSQLAHLDLDERTSEFCVVYMNGAYWGLYDLREKADDHDYTEYYYDQPKEKLQYLKTWGGTWSEYGGTASQTAWNELRTFILGNDMTIPANFAHVDSLYNWKSLIDYVVLNSYVVCSDWLNWNTAWWRGLNPDGDAQRWQYVLWDMDATFGHYINYTGIPNTTPAADPCNPEFLANPGGQGHIPILNQLMLNETFHQYYVSRYIDLSNTYLSCSYMQQVLDSMIAVIEPEMPAHIQKWGGSMATWQSNLTAMKNFIDARCTELADGLIDCYDVTGPYELVIKVDPPNGGTIKVNSLWLENYPFTGTYFGDIDVLLEAAAGPDFIFDSWQLNNNVFIPGASPEIGKVVLTAPDTIVAVFKNPAPVVELGSDTTICYGTSLLLNAENPGATYNWSNGNTTQWLSINQAGQYSVTVSNPYSSVVDQITIGVDYPPTVSLGDEFFICSGHHIFLDPETSLAESLLWFDNTTGPLHEISQPGTYWVQVFNRCGMDIDSTTVLLGTAAHFDLGTNRYLDPGDSLTLDVTSEDATYLWSDASTESSITITEPGYYWVVVENDCGTSFDGVFVYYSADLNIPNIFTPNQDGLNDLFSITFSGAPPSLYNLSIYNRWGEEIFHTIRVNEDWDGTFQGNPVPEGSYIYILQYQNHTGKHLLKGSITIIR